MLPKKKVLAVDDDPTVLKKLEIIITNMGHDLIAARDEEMAISLLRQEEVNLIITETLLPNTRCSKFLKELKNASSRTPVVAMTCFGKSSAQNALKAGADGYLLKPLNRQHVENVINSFL